jgi:ankyrin repeat protein
MKRKASPATSDADRMRRVVSFINVTPMRHVDKVWKMMHVGDVKELNSPSVQGAALMMATDEGNVEIVRDLLELGADVNSRVNPLRRQVLARAVEGGQEEVVKVLVAAGANLRSIECVDAFIRLVRRDFYDCENKRTSAMSMVGTLIDAGLNVDTMGTAGVLALTVAAANDDEAMTRLLLDKGADVDALNADGYTALMRAVNENREHMVQFVLECGADVNARSDAGETALILAGATDNGVLVEMLIDAGADVNALDDAGLTALMRDDCEDEPKRILLDAGAIQYDKPRPALDHSGSVHPLTTRSQRSFHLNVLHGNVDEVRQMLILSPSLVDEPILRGPTVETPLISASIAGDIAMVKELINHGANVNLVFEGSAALIHACVGGYTATVAALLLAGADVNAGTIDGTTALMYAIQVRSESIVRVLLHGGADVNARDGDGATALHIAAEKAGHDSMVRLLIANGADVNARDQSGETALFKAARFLRELNLRALIAANGRVNDSNNTGVTPLMQVVGLGYTRPEVHPDTHPEVVHLLLASGADVNAQDHDGMTALMHFVNGEYHYLESMYTFDLLLTHDGGSLDVNARANSGMTALMIAARDLNTSCVTALINAGADVNLTDENVRTALMHALEYGEHVDDKEDETSEIIDKLIKAGALPYYAAAAARENVLAQERLARAERAPAPAPAPVETPMQKSLLAYMSVLDEHASHIPEGTYLALTRELQNIYRGR